MSGTVKKSSGKTKYSRGFFTPMMRMYLAKSIIDSGRQIKCEKCGSDNNLEFHHMAYEPVYVEDIRIYCAKCHRNVKKMGSPSKLATVYRRNKRYCTVAGYRFEY